MLVYKVTNTKNNKVYIGKTTRSLEERWAEHCKKALMCRSALSKAIPKYGKDNFSLEVLYETSCIEDLNVMEEFFIKQFNSMSPYGYNLRKGGTGGQMAEEVKAKIRKSATGKTASNKTRKKLSKASKNRAPWNRKPVIGTNITTGQIIELPHSYADKRFCSAQIGYCCRGQRKTHKGFTWRYKFP